MNLSQEQQTVLDGIQNLKQGFYFVTGKAGTGKSTLLNHFRDTHNLVVLAPTGLAAVNVGGMTIHKFFGLKPGPLSPKNATALNEKKLNVLRHCHAIVIDEISMVRVDMLDYIDAVLRASLNKMLPFGGIPVITFGDVFQIEPIVSTQPEKDLINDRYDTPFFFSANALKDGFNYSELNHIFRQTEADYIAALNKLRVGDISGIGYFDQRMGPPKQGAIKISLTNWKSDAINQKELDAIPGEERTFYSKTWGEFAQANKPAPEVLNLKVGARVMTTANVSEADVASYVNGDLGCVTEINDAVIMVNLDNGAEVAVERYKWESLSYEYIDGELTAEVVGSYTQFPLRLAWSTTTHKCQGQNFDKAHLLLEQDSFSHGQTYVALSRCRTSEGLTLQRKLRPKDIMVAHHVVDWYNKCFVEK